MVVGLLINEFFELGINTLKVTYSSGKLLYNWLYNIQPENIEKNLINEIKKLNSRLEDIEEKLCKINNIE
tara:strand:+ start:367 stop:576 length:210 start_codon:yes stop_codon:yes gene_type:complete